MRWARSVLPPIVVGVAGLALWELVVRAGRIAPFILPAPSAIGEQLWLDRSVVWEAGLASGANALVGLIFGTVLALAAALLASRMRILAEVSVPIAALANALPIIALAPILNNMFEAGAPAGCAAVRLHRSAAGVVSRGHRRRGVGVLRRAPGRPGLADHLGSGVHRLPARVGLRGRRVRSRADLLSRHARGGTLRDALAA
jgi:hypothetical protein